MITTIEIIDQGVGMTPREVDQIFIPFFKKEGSKGIGMGMCVAYNLAVNRLGGTVKCRSTKGVGTNMTLTIPMNING